MLRSSTHNRKKRIAYTGTQTGEAAGLVEGAPAPRQIFRAKSNFQQKSRKATAITFQDIDLPAIFGLAYRIEVLCFAHGGDFDKFVTIKNSSSQRPIQRQKLHDSKTIVLTTLRNLTKVNSVGDGCSNFQSPNDQTNMINSFMHTDRHNMSFEDDVGTVLRRTDPLDEELQRENAKTGESVYSLYSTQALKAEKDGLGDAYIRHLIDNLQAHVPGIDNLDDDALGRRIETQPKAYNSWTHRVGNNTPILDKYYSEEKGSKIWWRILKNGIDSFNSTSFKPLYKRDQTDITFSRIIEDIDGEAAKDGVEADVVFIDTACNPGKTPSENTLYGGSKSKKRKRKSNKTRKRRRKPSKPRKHKKSKKPKTKRNPNKRKTKRK